MKIKLATLLVLVVGLSACSSGEKKIVSSDKGGSSASQDFEDDLSEPTKTGGANTATTKSSGNGDKKYGSLSTAYHSGDNTRITNEAAKILGQNPSDPVALNAVAMSLYKQGRVGAAKLLLEKAYEQNPKSSALLNNLAVIQIAEGDSQAALQTLKQAYRVGDRNYEVLGNLGSLYVQGGDTAKALPLLEEAYRSDKVSSSVAINYAICLRAAGQYDKAAKIYEAITKQNPRDVNAYLNYAILLIDYMKRPKEGLAAATKVKFLESERKDVLDRANALEKKARSEIK